MRIGVIGINHKLANLKLREQLAKACQKQFGIYQSIHQNHHFILLSTCNRTEVYFSSEDLANTHTYLLSILRQDVEEEFDHKLYSYFGVDCFSHLVRVTLGLDSAIVGETEIQRQVKMAYEATIEYHTLPKDMHFLFQKALGIAKRIRSKLQLGRGMPNLEHAVFNMGKYFFKNPENIQILFVGASEINYKILCYFKSKNLSKLTLCNRSDEQAQMMANSQSMGILNWNQLSKWHQYDWIIVGTKSPNYLLKQEDIQDSFSGQKLIIDLCVPRNVEPKLAQQLTLLNIDEINQFLKIRHQHMNEVLIKAENMVLTSAQGYMTRYAAKEQTKIIPLAVTA